MKRSILIAISASLLTSSAFAAPQLRCDEEHLQAMPEAMRAEVLHRTTHNKKVQDRGGEAVVFGMIGAMFYVTATVADPESKLTTATTAMAGAAAAVGAPAATLMISNTITTDNPFSYERIERLTIDASVADGTELDSVTYGIFSDMERARNAKAGRPNQPIETQTFAMRPDFQIFRKVLIQVIRLQPEICRSADGRQVFINIANAAVAEYSRYVK